MELKINKINVDHFKELILKLKKFNNNLYFKVNYDLNNKIVSNIYLDEYDGAKSISLDISEIFEPDKPFPKNLKILFYDADIIIKALDFFKNTTDLIGSIKYKKYNEEFIATDVFLNDTKTKIQLFCADEKLAFKDMTEDEKLRAYDFKLAFVKFKFNQDTLKEVLTYFKLDKDSDTFVLKVKPDGVYAIGTNYEAKLADEFEYLDKSKESITIYKEYITKYMDKEDYNLYACDNKLILESLNTQTLMTLAIAITTKFANNQSDEDETEFANFNLDI